MVTIIAANLDPLLIHIKRQYVFLNVEKTF